MMISGINGEEARVWGSGCRLYIYIECSWRCGCPRVWGEMGRVTDEAAIVEKLARPSILALDGSWGAGH